MVLRITGADSNLEILCSTRQAVQIGHIWITIRAKYAQYKQRTVLPVGAVIRTTAGYWNVIVNVKHPSMRGKDRAVVRTLTYPNEIRVSKKANDVFLFYRKYENLFLCVVVKIQKEKGFVITAYFTKKIKEGILKWKK